mmetsp:Transcript_32677/g.72187  ORF Transcript_32677/g.72187 Transcript_32677/m.72187 type:complete len:202 (+) Transcript_32677:1947-2552(+)
MSSPSSSSTYISRGGPDSAAGGICFTLYLVAISEIASWEGVRRLFRCGDAMARFTPPATSSRTETSRGPVYPWMARPDHPGRASPCPPSSSLATSGALAQRPNFDSTVLMLEPTGADPSPLASLCTLRLDKLGSTTTAPPPPEDWGPGPASAPLRLRCSDVAEEVVEASSLLALVLCSTGSGSTLISSLTSGASPRRDASA